MKAIVYDWGGFNIWLFHYINDLRGAIIDPIMQFGTLLAEHKLFWLYLLLILLARVWQLERQNNRGILLTAQQSKLWIIVIVTFILSYVIDSWLVSWLKHYFNYPRPPLVLPAGSYHLLTYKSDLNHSLPSGHTIFAATIAASLWPIARMRLRIGLTFFVIWVGLSRISLGIHFPADVVYGAIIGVSLVVILRQLLWIMIKPRYIAT